MWVAANDEEYGFGTVVEVGSCNASHRVMIFGAGCRSRTRMEVPLAEIEALSLSPVVVQHALESINASVEPRRAELRVNGGRSNSIYDRAIVPIAVMTDENSSSLP
jgi:hypothetical protein